MQVLGRMHLMVLYQDIQALSSVVPYTPDVACSPSAVVACSSSKLDHTSSASQSVATCSSTNIQNNKTYLELSTLTTVHRLLLISTILAPFIAISSINIMSLVHITVSPQGLALTHRVLNLWSHNGSLHSINEIHSQQVT